MTLRPLRDVQSDAEFHSALPRRSASSFRRKCMLKCPSLPRAFATAALIASALLPVPRTAHAQASPALNFHYWNGPLVQHVKVANLFWGPYWASASADVSYFNNFFQALFADGRFMANLAQYNAGAYTINTGSWIGADVDSQALPNPKQVTDA